MHKIILIISLLLIPTVSAISIDTARTSCVAPCLIYFEATDTQNFQTSFPFHEILYEWDFGDTNAGNWWLNNQPKNNAIGPHASHLFTQPGTYTITLNARDHSGTQESDTLTITIQDPDIVFSGSNTICVSNQNNFNDCPSGAQQINIENNLNLAQSYLSAGNRVLLRRGESWSQTGSIRINNPGPGQLGAYGPCLNADERGICENAPLIDPYDGTEYPQGISLSSGRSPNMADWTIMDLAFECSNYASNIAVGGTAQNILIWKNRAKLCRIFFTANIGVFQYYGADYPSNVAIIENRVQDTISNTSQTHQLYMALDKMSVKGNSFWNATRSHITRFPHLRKALIQNNRIGRPNLVGSHLIKLHAATYSDFDSMSREIIISENEFHSATESWAVAIGPQNHDEDERVIDVIFERNHLIGAPPTQVGLLIWARSVTARNNVFSMDGSSLAGNGISIAPRGIEPPPENIFIYHNSISTQSGYAVGTANTNGNIIAKNNIIAGGNVQATSGSGFTVNENNLVLQNPFQVPYPQTRSEFILNEGSAAIDAASPSNTFLDLFRSTRTGIPDLGAIESSNTQNTNCGNNQLDTGEVCDPTHSSNQQSCTTANNYQGTRNCNAFCTGYTQCVSVETCGDGIINGDEVCDTLHQSNEQSCQTSNNEPGTQTCNSDCLSYSTCASTSTCGNNQLDAGEVCDPTHASNSRACTTTNGYSGTETCNPSCSAYNTCTSTETCGDGIINGNEICDDGSNNGQQGNCNNSCDGTTQDTPQACGEFLLNEDFESGNFDAFDVVPQNTACATLEISNELRSNTLKNTISCTSAEVHRPQVTFLTQTASQFVTSFDVYLTGTLDNWISLFTPDTACTGETEMGINWASYIPRVTMFHVPNPNEGVLTYLDSDGNDITSLPLDEWVSLTAYFDLESGYVRVWQNNDPILEASINRAESTMCKFDYGVFSSELNSNIEGHYDNIKVWNLPQPLTDLSTPPTQTNSGADTDCSGDIDIGELLNYIGRWKNNEITITQVLQAITQWKNG